MQRGLGAAAINFRSCSGEPNRLARFYHSGDTGDLDFVVKQLLAERPGRPLALAGFSLGGNVVAKYTGESGAALAPEIRRVAVVSVPFDLGRCATAIDEPGFFRGALARAGEERTAKQALGLLARRVPEGPGPDATAAAWKKFLDSDAPFLFFSETGGYVWRIDPLAKRRKVPTAELRGVKRADP